MAEVNHGVQGSACPHCPDGHDDPAIKPWGVYVAADRDGDGQPLRLTVQPSDGSHVADSDAEWLWQLINDEAVLRANTRRLGPAEAAIAAVRARDAEQAVGAESFCPGCGRDR